MELVLGYIESLAFWRAQRIANNPIAMSRNPILRDVYPALDYHERTISTESSSHRSVPPIAFDEYRRIPLAEIKNYITYKLDPLTLCEDSLSLVRNMSSYAVSSMLAYNMYKRISCEHARHSVGSVTDCDIHDANIDGFAHVSHTSRVIHGPRNSNVYAVGANRVPRLARMSFERLHAVRFVPDISNISVLHFIAPRSQRGLCQTNKQMTYINSTLPHGSLHKLFIRAAERDSFGLPESLNLYIVSPELAVLLAAQNLRTLCLENVCSTPRCPARTRGKLLFTHNVISLVNELCGSYGYDPLTASGATYGLDPLTSVQKIRHYAEKMKRIHGCGNLLVALDYCYDNLASVFEGVVASALMLPTSMGGIAFPELQINKTRTLSADRLLTPHHKSITPDLSSRKHKLVIECNGLEFHRSDESIKEDHRRLRDYVSHGERHIPLTVSDVKNPLALSHALEEIVAACHDTLGASKTCYLRKIIHNAKYQMARQIMLDLQMS